MIHAIDDALRDLPEAPDLIEQASALVRDWKEANGIPLLSPEAARDLAGRIMLMLIEERATHSAAE